MTCSVHRRYKGIHRPRWTEKFPDGCEECWDIWHTKQVEDKKPRKYKTMKVFDCQDMPEDIRRTFFDDNDFRTANDVVVNHQIGEPNTPEQEALDKWLVENGADVEDEVLIKHWW